MSTQAITICTSGSTAAGAVSRVTLVSQAVTGPSAGIAAQVAFTPTGTIAATNVQAAIAEVATDAAAAYATATGLSDHLADTTDAHDASAISLLDTANNYTATEVEAALAEVKVLADAAVTPAEAAAAYEPAVVVDSVLYGGGAVDATTAINDAITAAVNRVIVPAGTYSVSTITVGAGKTLELLPGAILTSRSGGEVVHVFAGSTLKGGTVRNSGTYNVKIKGSDATVSGVTISGSTLYGLGIEACSNASVAACVFADNTSYGILAQGAVLNLSITDNLFTGTGQGLTVKAVAAGQPAGVLIARNRVTCTGTVGIECQSDATTYGPSNIVVADNVVSGPAYGITFGTCHTISVSGNVVTGATTYGIELAQGCYWATVAGNTVRASGYGISVTKGAASYAPHGVTISSNTVIRSTSLGAIKIDDSVDIQITGNTIEDPKSRGVNLNTCNDCSVSGNRIIYSQAAAVLPYTDPQGIYTTNGSDLDITDNVIDYRTGTSGNAVYVNETLRVSIINNRMRGAERAIILYATAASTHFVDGNRTNDTTTDSFNLQAGSGTVTIGSHQAAVASGSVFNATVFTNATWLHPIIGSGTPESSVVAAIGTLYRRTNGGATTTLYVKESGTGNTGWVAK